MFESMRGKKAAAARSRVSASRPAKQPRPESGFWHQPTLINLVADVLIVSASLALAWACVVALQRLPFFPLRELHVAGDLGHVQRAQIEHATRTMVSGNFFTVDIDGTRKAFETLPWVRRVEVRRQWPDRLELAIEEHVPVARWKTSGKTDQLVNSHGEVFSGSVDLPLPVFSGPEGTSAEVLARFREFDKALSKIDRHPRAVALSAREAWQVRLDNGLLLDLGRDQAKLPLADRMARFVEYYPAAQTRAPFTVVAVDMRYPNGFSLRPARFEKSSS